MVCTKPKMTGLALGSTVAILYSLCAATMAVFPSIVPGFAKTVAHGINLNALEFEPFSFFGFLAGLVLISAYAFVAGYLYRAVANGLSRKESEQGGTVRTTTAARACH